MAKTFWIQTEDGMQIYAKKWQAETEPRALFLISHGMTEHIERYEEFASYMAAHGMIVYGHDHRGHGRTGDHAGMLGVLAERDGFEKTAEDIFTMVMLAKLEHPGLPVYLFGHSMGSFLIRLLMQTYSSHINGVILSGTGYFPKHEVVSGRLLAGLLSANKEAPLMNALTFGAYNRKISQMKTPFDWLSRDRQEVEKYLDDPFCGFIPPARFFSDLMTGLLHIHNRKQNRKIRKDLPLLIAGGTADPVGSFGAGIWKTAQLYEKVGLEEIAVMLFDGARHELLHEINREAVFQAFLQWIEQQL